MKPITPTQARKAKNVDIPDVVVEAVNALITKNLKGNEARIVQDDLIKEIMTLNPEMTSTVLYKNNWLDVEPLFEKNGWKVEYNKPRYGDDGFDAYFIFTVKRGKK